MFQVSGHVKGAEKSKCNLLQNLCNVHLDLQWWWPTKHGRKLGIRNLKKYCRMKPIYTIYFYIQTYTKTILGENCLWKISNSSSLKKCVRYKNVFWLVCVSGLTCNHIWWLRWLVLFLLSENFKVRPQSLSCLFWPFPVFSLEFYSRIKAGEISPS